MGRRPLPPEKVKTNLTIGIRKETIDLLKKEKHYNALIQRLLDEYFEKKNVE